MSGGHLGRNLAALAAHQTLPVDRLAAPSETVRIQESNGAATLLLRRSGAWIALNSRRDPVTEAGRWLDEALPDAGASTAIVIGTGLGYVLDALDARRPEVRVLAIEPTPECARALLDHRDWAERVGAGRLRVLVGPDFAGTDDVLWMLEGTTPPVVTHPTLAHELPNEVAAAQRAAARAVYAAQANRDARLANAGRYLTNTLRNAATISSESDVSRLDGLFAGRPAVVISAGPSLDRSLDDLRRLQDQALLIAVDTALRPLLASGVVPHLVVALDPTRGNAEHMLDLPDPSGVYLIAEGSVNQEAFAPFRGRTFVFRVADHHPWPWLASLGCDRGRLQVWGSVATAAFDVARRVGANPIIFCGQDLAYTNGRSYCRGTTWERTATPAGKRAEIADVDIRGDKTTTASHLVSFRDWLVEQSRDESRRYVNASEGGILRGGRLELLALADALSGSPTVDRGSVRDRLRAAHLPGGTRVDVAAATTALARTIDTDANSHPEPTASWLTFAGPATTPGAIARALSAQAPESTVAALSREPKTNRRPLALSPADQARLDALTSSDDVRAFSLDPEVGTSDSDVTERLERALGDLSPGGRLVIVDLTDRVVGARLRRAMRKCLAQHRDLAHARVGMDWLSRLTVIQRDPPDGRLSFAMNHADADVMAELIVRALDPGSVASVGPGANVWLDAFSAYPRVTVVKANEHCDVVLAMRSFVEAASTDHEPMLAALAARSDTIVIEVPTPALEFEPHANYRPMTYWAELFLRFGYVLSDQLRPLIEDRGDFNDRSYDFYLLYVARRIGSAETRAALASSSELRALVVNGLSRIDDLYVQAMALRLDRRDAGTGRPAHTSATASVPLDPDDFEHAGGHAYVLRFAGRRLRAAQRAGLLRHATIEEDGRPLPFALELAAAVQAEGGGRYTVRRDAVYFSATDSSDPRLNGRAYSLRVEADVAVLISDCDCATTPPLP